MLQGGTVHHGTVGEVAGQTASTIRKQSNVKAVAPLALSLSFRERSSPWNGYSLPINLDF